MAPFWRLLRNNPNYRYTWMGQVVSEVGDHFNSIAVLSLALHLTGSGMAVGAVMIARTLPAIVAGVFAGVILDRADRKQVMIVSDLFRALVALAFVLILTHHQHWLLYALSGLLTGASPFFTNGRAAILPRITTPEELHTANALTQTTQWLTLSIGTMLGGISTMQFGYEWAFVANAASFLFSAWAIWNLRSPEGHFRPFGRAVGAHAVHDLWRDYVESIRYMRATPLVLAIGLVWTFWATGGGAAQILFTLFGEQVYQGGPAAIGLIWGFAGIGLVIGGLTAHRLGPRLDFNGYKRAIHLFLWLHGVSYVLFALMPTIWGALIFIALSRIGMGANNVLNRTVLLTHVPDRLRGRVFSTHEMMMNGMMMISLAAGGIATQHFPVRAVGAVAGVLSASTAIYWGWANWTGRLPEPLLEPARAAEDYEAPVTPA